MRSLSASLTPPARSRRCPRQFVRLALFGAVFLALFITGQQARDAAASSPPQAPGTIPPPGGHTDRAAYALFLPQMAAVRGDTDTVDPIGEDKGIDGIDDKDADDKDADDEDADDKPVDDKGSGCPVSSEAVYASLPVVGPAADHPAPIHGDLNLGLRGYTTATVPLTLVDINGDTDGDPPQLATIVAAQGPPSLVAGYRVNEWNWLCMDDPSAPWYGHGCRGEPISYPDVTLLALGTETGVPIRAPARNAEIHAGGYVALVLYAEETRLTLVYTREDTPARGYVVHLENFCVDAALLQLYQNLDAFGRSSLPAVRSQEQLGTSASTTVKTAIRDTGSFMDPRSRKDWWKGY